MRNLQIILIASYAQNNEYVLGIYSLTLHIEFWKQKTDNED